MSKPIKIGIIFFNEKVSLSDDFVFKNFFKGLEKKINNIGYVYSSSAPSMNQLLLLRIKNIKNNGKTSSLFKIKNILLVPKTQNPYNSDTFIEKDTDCYIFLSGFDDYILDQDEYTIDNVIQSF